MSDKKGIVLNRMYTGSYLSSNLGHEVINMFPDDDGNYYMYLNATGDFSAEHAGKIGSMLLIKYTGQDKYGKPWVEVLGCAIELKDIYNSKQRKQSEEDYVPCKGNSFKIIKEIKYGGVPIHDIFKGYDQQDVLISYYAEKLLLPKNDVKIYLCFAPFGDETIQASRISTNSGRYIVEMAEKFASTSLKRYILEKDNKEDYNSLNNLISLDIWQDAVRDRIIIPKAFKPHQISLFDIMPKLQRDENCFSDAFSYFIKRDAQEWQKILEKICRDDNLGKIVSVKREKDASISKDNKGGRIDLLIRTENAYIVIENKIKSDVNRSRGDLRGENQLDRYREYINHCVEGNGDIKSYFFILAPDYNMPDKEERKGYEPLYYSTLVGKLKDGTENAEVVEMMKQYHEAHKNENLWSAFYDAMQRHSYDYENDSLYGDMKNTFFARIKQLNPNSNTDKNA